MGKGKGNVEGWVACGQARAKILYEMEGVIT